MTETQVSVPDGHFAQSSTDNPNSAAESQTGSADGWALSQRHAPFASEPQSSVGVH
ncbi:MAG TPA: hypothetical protein VFU81_03820 [Thermomicrobiales bacterium]|nr:hypothetical protein [Thermomicrobiales bacterium]